MRGTGERKPAVMNLHLVTATWDFTLSLDTSVVLAIMSPIVTSLLRPLADCRRGAQRLRA